MAAGTTLVDSGLIAHLVASFSIDHPDISIAVVGLSSAEAISLADAGSTDLILTHSQDRLSAFLNDNPGLQSRDVFASSFFLVAESSIDLSAPSLAEALTIVFASEYEFVSRDDGSGTNAAELAGWQLAGLDPSDEPWYIRTGTPMGSTLLVADQRHAVTLAEEGSFLAAAGELSLMPVANTSVPNIYQVTLVDPDSYAASTFFGWLVSPAGRAALVIANRDLFGEQVYVSE